MREAHFNVYKNSTIFLLDIIYFQYFILSNVVLDISEYIQLLEPIIQSEVSQKEKHQYRILTHIYGI